MHLGDGDHRRIERRHVARHHGLQAAMICVPMMIGSMLVSGARRARPCR